MKNLSIEEFKKIEYGDWIWLKDDNLNKIGTYSQLVLTDADKIYVCQLGQLSPKPYYFREYTKTWITYKNKEQANI